MSKKKAIAATAFLTTLMIIAFITPFSLVETYARGHRPHRHRPHHPHHPHHPSPLSKSIEITFVYPDGKPIGAGLTVELYDGPPNDLKDTQVTDSDGKVTFAGLVDETYTWKWSWQGTEYSRSEEITCSDIVWEFTETVAYWTECSSWEYGDETPIVGLLINTIYYTDTKGEVCFPTLLKAGTYKNKWSWQGSAFGDYYEEFTIGFETPSPYHPPTNVLPYWTVEKTFYYEGTEITVPDGLEVILRDPNAIDLLHPMDKQLTADGKVTFENVKAGEYTIEWVWGGGLATIEPFSIGFADVTLYVIPDNFLGLKSGGGVNLHLPEELG